MKLKELKKMIAEEYAAYKRNSRRIKEQDLPGMDMPMDDPMGGMGGMDMGGAPGGAPKIDVGPDDVKVGGKEEDPMATLKSIFDMLKDFFEGDDKPAAKDDKPLDPDMPAMPDIPGLDLKEAFKKRKLSRKRKGVKRTVMVERFKKLANIIK